MFSYRLFGFFGIVMLFACGTVMNPRMSRPTVQYYLGDENTAALTADSTVQANSWVLIAQQTGNRRFARLVKGSPSLISLDSLFKDSAWVKVPYGSIWSGRLNRLERRAGHGKKDRLLPKLNPGNLHVFGFAEKRFKWALGLNQSVSLQEGRFRFSNYKEVNMGIEWDVESQIIRVKVKNKTDEPIRIWEPNVRERFQVEALGRGKNRIHVFWADSTFLTNYLSVQELQPKKETIVLEMPLDKLLGASPAGRWVKKNEAERPDVAKGDRIIPELLIWVNLNYRGKSRVSPMLRIPLSPTVFPAPLAQ
jgi:hypothetical protein